MVVLGNDRGFRISASPEILGERQPAPADAAQVPRDYLRNLVGVDTIGGAIGQTAGPVQGSVDEISTPPSGPVGVQLGDEDDRILINLILALYPYRTIGTLSSDPDGGTGCTGTLVGPRHVITAGHCLYNANGWFQNVYFNLRAKRESRMPTLRRRGE